ncbi:MAG: site-specific integrase [Isosphaeraceae bacterium]
MAERSAPTPDRPDEIPLEEGRALHMSFAGRARVAGGERPSSLKRYRAVLDKFTAYAHSKGLRTWDRVTTQTIQGYAGHLESEGHAYRTQYLELTTLKQAFHWLVKQGHLSVDLRIDLPLGKPQARTPTAGSRPRSVPCCNIASAIPNSAGWGGSSSRWPRPACGSRSYPA